MNKLFANHPMSEIKFVEKGQLMILNGTIIWPNFSARAFGGELPASDNEADKLRSFKVIIDDPDMANQLNDEGWSISIVNDTETGEIYHTLKVKVSYRLNAPKIFMHTKNGVATARTKETVGEIDQDDIIPGSCSMLISPSKYDYMGKRGVSGYLNKLDYTIQDSSYYDAYNANLEG